MNAVSKDQPERAAGAILDCGRNVLLIESRAVAALVDCLDSQFEKAVRIILGVKGRVIITGIGKSGIVGKKIAATLSSTGTPAFFLHPVEALHGDVGMVTREDAAICLSKSGNTDEVSELIPILKKIGVPIITLTGNVRSALAERSDVVIKVAVSAEACPNDLAPTASTTAMMAMGDALAMALLEQKKFDSDDFALLHPGGSLGRKLQKIDDIMFTDAHIPTVERDAELGEVISEITRKRFGCVCVVDDGGKLEGIITDGDLRRLMQRTKDMTNVKATDIMNAQPKVVQAGSLATQALQKMEHNNILQLVVIDSNQTPVGMVHLHDLLEAGIGSR